MKSEDTQILKEIQKNADMAMKAINTVSEKVIDEGLSRQLAKQSLEYGEFFNRAARELIEANEDSYKSNFMQNTMLRGGIESNTLFNTSSSHIAEMMIQGSNRGITDMYKTLKHNEKADNKHLEVAKELMDFEEKNIEKLKEFL